MEPARAFTREDLLITPDLPEEAYRRRNESEKKAVHWGQLKLLMNEILFFSLFWDPTAVPNPVVVYAGAAPGAHIPFLASMFPTFVFHLYDPRPFGISGSDRIHVHQQLFLDADAKRWANRRDVLFISDIRTADYTQMEGAENEAAIMADMRMQENWHNIIKPVRSHLKFRLPYVEGYAGAVTTVRYLNGFVFRQPWAPQTSTETRLVPTTGETDWSSKKYEDQLFYHNAVVRERFRFLNPLTNNEEPIDPGQGLTNDYDSTAHIVILLDYLLKMGGEEAVTAEAVLKLSQAVIASISRGSKNITQLRQAGGKIVHKSRTQRR